MSKKMIILAIGCVILLIASIWLIGIASELLFEPSGEGEDVIVTIEEGSNLKTITKVLKKNGVIKNEMGFILKVKSSGYNGKLQYGTFELNTKMPRAELIKKLATEGAKAETVKIVIPEGYSIEQIAAKVEEVGFCTKTEFIEAIKKDYDYGFLEGIPNKVEYKLQGFLFPSTYEMLKEATAEDLVKKMLDAFDYRFGDTIKANAAKQNKTVYEILTIAAMVEREAKLQEERSTIAGVIYNRLKINMKLQIDATVQYVVSDGLYNVTKIYYKDLEVNSPYNTYKNAGLPVGPICNPGQQSIEAALSPKSHEYLYYRVIDESTGKHQFTKTYEEHTN